MSNKGSPLKWRNPSKDEINPLIKLVKKNLDKIQYLALIIIT